MKLQKSSRADVRTVFGLRRRLLPRFHTTSVAKFLQARLVFGRAGLDIHAFRSDERPYPETYEGTSTDLLREGLTALLGRIGRSSLVFIEDTSLRVNALSAHADVPGLAVKEWFADLDADDMLAAINRSGDPGAVVRSDVALYVPGLDGIITFRGETAGIVAGCPPSFQENPLYPWLTPNSFNGWFIPDGASTRLGAMTLEESWHYDFRVKAFTQLIDRLAEYAALLNLTPSAYRRAQVFAPGQLSILPVARPLLLVTGRICAGKTTLADCVRLHKNLPTIESSAIVRTLAAELGLQSSTPF